MESPGDRGLREPHGPLQYADVGAWQNKIVETVFRKRPIVHRSPKAFPNVLHYLGIGIPEIRMPRSDEVDSTAYARAPDLFRGLAEHRVPFCAHDPHGSVVLSPADKGIGERFIEHRSTG